MTTPWTLVLISAPSSGWRTRLGRTETELLGVVSEGLAASPINQVLVEESVLGWGDRGHAEEAVAPPGAVLARPIPKS